MRAYHHDDSPFRRDSPFLSFEGPKVFYVCACTSLLSNELEIVRSSIVTMCDPLIGAG